MQSDTALEQLAAGVARDRDTCNVHVPARGGQGVLVDFGSGGVLEHLDELGVERAGQEGAVVSEFSSRSRDELDVFTDPAVERTTVVGG